MLYARYFKTNMNRVECRMRRECIALLLSNIRLRISQKGERVIKLERQCPMVTKVNAVVRIKCIRPCLDINTLVHFTIYPT